MKVRKDGVTFVPMQKGIQSSHRVSNTLPGKKDGELEEDGGDYVVANNYNRANHKQVLVVGKKYSFDQAKAFGL